MIPMNVGEDHHIYILRWIDATRSQSIGGIRLDNNGLPPRDMMLLGGCIAIELLLEPQVKDNIGGFAVSPFMADQKAEGGHCRTLLRIGVRDEVAFGKSELARSQ